ncbi:MAG: DUF2460 domain-containing protein [Chitinispirillia bacterium]|nr:DUF2460 domain-containing protein [Chitinispirillia bacterium]
MAYIFLKLTSLLIIIINSLAFSTTSDTLITDESNITILSQYETNATPSPTIYLHPKRSVPTLALLADDSITTSTASLLYDDYSNLSISGYKSFGVSVGSLGEVNLEQGLEVIIEGEIRPGTHLSAYLSDEGSSLDGSTREISDFDQVNITLTNENFTVIAGDQFAVWSIENGILSGQKKIMGISAEVTPKSSSVNAFGSFSGGNHTVQTVRGRDGVQGPYYLIGKGEAGFITPINGTVKVRVNGNNLKEGFDNDFTVDYDMGSITFNPKVLIRQEDFIRIEYEYKYFDYRRTFAGGGASHYTQDSVFSFSAAIWSESDNKNSPIEMQLTEYEKEILRRSGNNPGYAAPTARPVHPHDVARMSAYFPLYRKVYDAQARDTILVYSPYDPLRPNDIRDRYTAWFTPIQKGSIGADYVIDSSIVRNDHVYKYAGAGEGDFTMLAPLSAPARESFGEFEARINLPYFSASLNVAGNEHDENLFSSIDDDDNLSSAAVFKMFGGERRIDKRSGWIALDYRYRSRNFTNELFSEHERREGWDSRRLSDNTEKHEFHAWESMFGGTAVKGIAARMGAGQTYIDSLVETEKVTGDAELRFAQDKLELNLGAAAFRHHMTDIDYSYRRYNRFFVRPAKAWEAMLGYSDEWSVDTTKQGAGHISGAAQLSYLPASLLQNFTVTQFRSGEALSASSDTGHAFTWNQSAAFAPVDGWNLTGDSRWHKRHVYGESSSSTFLMGVVSEIEPTSWGFSSRQEYRTNQELSSRFEQKMFYIGKGLGTHAYDSLTREFRPSINGDHIIQEIEIYDNTSDATVRKTTLNGDWYFRPKREIDGIFGDLTWSGILFSEEHINARNKNTAGRIPGLLTLYYLNKDDSAKISDIHFADLSYRQDIDHHIKGSAYKSRLYLLPGLRFIRDSREMSFETALRVERRQNRLLLSTEPRYLFVNKEAVSTAHGSIFGSGDFDLHDISAELVQSIEYLLGLEFYVRERVGMWRRKDPNPFSYTESDSSIYLQIKPGIIYRPQNKGMAELSYTFSYVPYDGVIDYRAAAGHSSGISHIVSFYSDLYPAKHFNFSGMYRGELRRSVSESAYGRMQHVFSLQVKAFL